MQPSARNISRCGSISIRKALPAEVAMKPSSPPILSIASALRDIRHARLRPRRMCFAQPRSTLHSALQGQIKKFGMTACITPG